MRREIGDLDQSLLNKIRGTPWCDFRVEHSMTFTSYMEAYKKRRSEVHQHVSVTSSSFFCMFLVEWKLYENDLFHINLDAICMFRFVKSHRTAKIASCPPSSILYQFETFPSFNVNLCSLFLQQLLLEYSQLLIKNQKSPNPWLLSLQTKSFSVCTLHESCSVCMVLRFVSTSSNIPLFDRYEFHQTHNKNLDK